MPMKGMKAEGRVASSLRAKGASVEQSPGSRTSADIVATWPNGKKWYVQVKSSSTGKPAVPSPSERSNLIARASRNSGVPVYAAVTPEKIDYHSMRSGKRL